MQKTRQKKSKKPAHTKFKKSGIIFRNLVILEPQIRKGHRYSYTLRLQNHDSGGHFLHDFAPKVDRKHRVAPTSHLGRLTGFYRSRIVLMMILCLCGVSYWIYNTLRDISA